MVCYVCYVLLLQFNFNPLTIAYYFMLNVHLSGFGSLGLTFVMKGQANVTESITKYFVVRGKAVEKVRIEKRMGLKVLVNAVGRDNVTFEVENF